MTTGIEALRALSRAAFGQTYRLEVMLAIADSEDGLVTLTDLARDLDISTSNVQVALRSLVASGLLSELPKDDNRRKYLLRNPSSAWEWAREMRNQLEIDSVSGFDPGPETVHIGSSRIGTGPVL